jgi:hypothetical protein
MQALADKKWSPEGTVETRYKKARQEWDARMGLAVVQARNWRLATFLSGAARPRSGRRAGEERPRAANDPRDHAVAPHAELGGAPTRRRAAKRDPDPPVPGAAVRSRSISLRSVSQKKYKLVT